MPLKNSLIFVLFFACLTHFDAALSHCQLSLPPHIILCVYTRNYITLNVTSFLQFAEVILNYSSSNDSFSQQTEKYKFVSTMQIISFYCESYFLEVKV